MLLVAMAYHSLDSLDAGCIFLYFPNERSNLVSFEQGLQCLSNSKYVALIPKFVGVEEGV